MKKFVSIIIVCAITLFLVACAETQVITVNVDNQENLNSVIIGQDALIRIGNGLYYDSTTRIVYWWSGVLSKGSAAAATPSPYYAPNGLPYRYNPETNTFEEITRSDMNGTD